MPAILIYTIPIALAATLTFVFVPLSLAGGSIAVWHKKTLEENAPRASAAERKLPDAPIHL